MTKKIISAIMAAGMIASAVPAMATTEGILQGDILLTSIEAEPTRSYNNYTGVAEALENGILSVTIDDMSIPFAITEKTPIYTIKGEEASEVKAGDKVIVISSAALKTKDIKSTEAVIICDDEYEASVYVDTFNATELDTQLISADGQLALNLDNAADYEGKKLLVFYQITTFSIPPQTHPEKIVVLEEEEHKTLSFKVGSSVLNINGTEVEVEAPYIAGEGVTLVPMRVIAETFGAEVAWDGETKSVEVKDGETTIKITIGSKTATVNGEEKELEEAPEITNDTSMIPLRFISEELGAEVKWDGETSSINVVK